MRILIWTDAFLPEIGGMEVFCMRLAVGLKERGHECLIVTNRRDSTQVGPSFYQGIPVHGFDFQNAAFASNLRLLREQHEACGPVIAAFDPDVTHLNIAMRSALGFMLQQRQKSRPTVLTLHDNLLFKHQQGLSSALLDSVDAIAAISESVRLNALSWRPEIATKLHKVLNALPMPEVLPTLLPTEPCLLAFGRLVKDKGFDLAIEAFARVARQFPTATLTMAGEGSEFRNLQALAREAGLAERIHFPGWIDPEDIPALLNRHSLVLMPSRWQEPFGLVALQTAQMGRPIIASRTGGIPEIVVDGQTGILFENENLPALTEALRLLLGNPTLGSRLGEQAYRHALNHFNFDRFIGAYENLYAKISAKKCG